MKKWEPWQLPEYAESRLNGWGAPTSPTEQWIPHKYHQLKKLPTMITGDTVLDVGCGLGHTYVILKPHVEQYLGVDSSKAMIDICHRYFPEHLFKVGDIYDLSQFDVYDTVISTQVLIHLPDLELPLKQLWEHAGKELIFTLRPISHPKRMNTWKPKPLKKEDDVYLISHNYSQGEMVGAINKLDSKKAIRVYTVDDAPNIMYIKITRDTTGNNKTYNTSIFKGLAS